MILLVAVVVVVWVESLLFVLVCVRFFFRFRKGEFVLLCACLCLCLRLLSVISEEEGRRRRRFFLRSLSLVLLFFVFRALIASGDRPLWKPPKKKIRFYVSSASLCFVLDLMRLSEVLGFRCFLLVFSISSVLFFLWRRWTTPLLSLLVSLKSYLEDQSHFFLRKDLPSVPASQSPLSLSLSPPGHDALEKTRIICSERSDSPMIKICDCRLFSPFASCSQSSSVYNNICCNHL